MNQNKTYCNTQKDQLLLRNSASVMHFVRARPIDGSGTSSNNCQKLEFLSYITATDSREILFSRRWLRKPQHTQARHTGRSGQSRFWGQCQWKTNKEPYSAL